MPVFTGGAEQAEERARAAQSFSGKVRYLSQDLREAKGAPVYIRVITEHGQWIPVDVHQGVPTKPAPKDFKGGKWPETMSAVCANDIAFRLRGPDGKILDEFEPPATHYGHCYIHEGMADVRSKFGKLIARPVPMVFALVALREPVLDRNGAIVGMRDKTMEFEGKKGAKAQQVPVIRVASHKWSNFFGPIRSSMVMTDSVCVRDFVVTQDGTEIDVTPMDQSPDHRPGTESWKAYDDALALTSIDLVKFVTDQATPEYYGRFFDPRVTVAAGPEDDDEAAGPAGDEISAGDEEVEAKIAALRRRFEESRTVPSGPADASAPAQA